MKLQIDIDNKTIKIEESISLKKLFDVLNGLFPENAWEEYKLITETIVNWSYPIQITPFIQPYEQTVPSPWWEINTPYYGGTTGDLSVELTTIHDGENTITLSNGDAGANSYAIGTTNVYTVSTGKVYNFEVNG